MKTKSEVNALPLLLFLLIPIFLFILSLDFNQASAAPAFIPTPVANVNLGSAGRVLNIFPTEAITVATRRCVPASPYDYLDLQYIIDQATTTNTLTMTLQYSNDIVNFEAGPVVASGISADGASLTQRANFGAYACIYATVDNTNTVTATVIAVGK